VKAGYGGVGPLVIPWEKARLRAECAGQTRWNTVGGRGLRIVATRWWFRGLTHTTDGFISNVRLRVRVSNFP